MKKHFLPAALIIAAVLSAGAAHPSSDPVVMTINGKDVRQSEFQYLYTKNNQQQLQPQTIDEYVDMFVVYKLKVADAEAAGIDTTATFRSELEGYCSDLARPYMRDSLVEKRLMKEAYARMATSRRVSHIMLPIGQTVAEREMYRERMDSIRNAILSGASFEEMALKHSSDRSVVRNHGDMGFINANSFPYPFELASYTTPVGEVSDVVEDAPYGFHIVKVVDEKPNPGMVSARHILKLTQGLTREETAVKKAQIDSIYALLAAGADFEDMARRESEDPGSAVQGGRLGRFGTGQMVPEFETAAFSLKDGEISKPFATAYGYHIVQTLEHHGIGSFEEARSVITAAMNRDIRSRMPETERIREYMTEYGIKSSREGMAAVRAAMEGAATPADAFQAVGASDIVVATMPGREIRAYEVCADIPENVRESSHDAFTTFTEGAEAYLRNATVNYAMSELARKSADYRNLVNEYRDGILLFEISNRNVWDRSSKDTEGLEAYFRANRSSYAWDRPRYKGYVIFATNDSIASEARGFLARNKVASDSLVKTLRGKFGHEIKVERVLAAKGDNAIIDDLAFGGEKATPVGKWISWFQYAGKVIDAPEEAADVRGQVTTDYQQQLESEWVKQLRSRYKVKINRKAIRKVAD